MTRIKWSKEESDLLKKVYSTKTALQLREFFPQYTNTQILRRAKRLGLKKDPLVRKESREEGKLINRQDLWTDEEKKIVIDYYPKEGLSGVKERLPHRPETTIIRAASRLGVVREQKDLVWKQKNVTLNPKNMLSITVVYKGY